MKTYQATNYRINPNRQTIENTEKFDNVQDVLNYLSELKKSGEENGDKIQQDIMYNLSTVYHYSTDRGVFDTSPEIIALLNSETNTATITPIETADTTNIKPVVTCTSTTDTSQADIDSYSSYSNSVIRAC